MRRVRSKEEFRQMKGREDAYILNARPDDYKLHKAACGSVENMSVAPHPKFYSEDYESAKAWLDENYPTWRRCGYCLIFEP
jgi:hypothetical protein